MHVVAAVVPGLFLMWSEPLPLPEAATLVEALKARGYAVTTHSHS